MADENVVAVLMSTYNGEKYIEEQIDSILFQNGVRVRLFVRDDGSSDRTLEILDKYEKNEKLTIIPANKNFGPGKSFMTLFYKISKFDGYDYIAFADQDDIWLPDKLRMAVERLQKIKDRPALYGSNRLIYRDGKHEGLLFQYPLDNSLERHISKNEISGCTMVMNKELFKTIVEHPCPPEAVIDYRLHDGWIALVAILNGTLIYDQRSFILYRIHDNNAVGIRKVNAKEKFNRLLRRGNNGKRRANLRSNTARVLLEYYPEIKGDHRRVLEEYAYYRDSIKNKIRLMCDKNIIRGTDENTFVWMLKVMVGFV